MLFGILSGIYSILQLAGTVLLVNVVGEKYFPQLTSRIQEYLAWNGLKCYTIVKGQCENYIKKGNLYLNNYFEIDNNKDYVQFVRNGVIVKYYNTKYIIRDENDNDKSEKDYPKCDFILQFIKIDQYYNNKFEYNVVRFNTIKELVEYNTTTTKPIYTISPAKFLGMKIVISNVSKEIDININSGCNNFCMSSNIVFDRPFIHYYLKQIYNITLNENDTYGITFIDQAMEQVIVTDDHSIELTNDGYKIWFQRT